jgi:urease accessory protein
MTARYMVLLSLFTLIITLAAATPVFAHPGHGGHLFVDGWEHPFSGWDHLLAMVAVGLLAVRMGERAIWIIPCTFLGSMLAGGLLARIGLPLPGVEWGIMASVLVLGLLIATTTVVPLKYGVLLVAVFAALHGHAHAAEMAAGGSLATYAAGFLLATAALHVGGVALGLGMARWLNPSAIRFAGGLISTLGLLLLCGIIQA